MLTFNKEITKLRAMSSPVIQQAFMQEIAKLTNAKQMLKLSWANDGFTCELKDVADFWSLPAKDLSCNVEQLLFRRVINYTCPDYDNTVVSCSITYNEPLPKDMLAVLYMLDKIEVTNNAYTSKSVICKI